MFLLEKQYLNTFSIPAVECPDPHIANGYTELSPPVLDDEYITGTTHHLSKRYNESLQVATIQSDLISLQVN